MQKVLTAAQMREVDRLTTEKYGIPSITLMENAAHAVARVVSEKLGGSVNGKSILILCGKGNNGGDGAALGRILAKEGAIVNVELFSKISEASGDARENFDKYHRLANSWFGVRPFFCEVTPETEDNGVSEWMNGSNYNECDVVVDALFGTGLTRPLDGFFEEVVGALNSWKKTYGKPIFVSVDLPSGLNTDDAIQTGEAFRADTTVTFTSPKAANILPQASHFNGELIVANIGSPQELIDEQPSRLYVTENGDAAKWLKQTEFSDDSYKNKRGHAFLIAGSEDYSGAAVLAGNAAMRSGVGLVTLAAPKECKAAIASRLLPDIILKGIDAETDAPELMDKADSIGIGCGLSATDPSVEKVVRNVVASRKVPVIIDAGALWLYSPMQKPAGVCSPHVSKGSYSADEPPLIFTPHEGEFLRLLGTDDKDAIKDRVTAVREFATKYNVILVLKGERVLIGEPGGKVVVNPTGNSGLGKAGNGDTLTGILAGFVAQANAMNMDTFETVVAAVYVAGMAGDIAEKKFGKRVMTASDVRECLTEVFRSLEQN